MARKMIGRMPSVPKFSHAPLQLLVVIVLFAASAWLMLQSARVNAATLSALSLTPSTVIGADSGGTQSTGTVSINTTFTSPVVVSLTSDTSSVQMPSTVTIPVGSTSNTFTITSGSVTSTTTAQIQALYSGVTQTQTLTINPWLASLSTIQPVVGGNTASSTITLNAPAPTGGLPVSVSVSGFSSGVVTPPANGTVTVPAGQTSVSFSLGTGSVTAAQTGTVYTSYSGFTLSQPLTVQPMLASIYLASNTVNGGSGTTGTVTINEIAPTGGIAIALSSSNTSVATVAPTSVSIAAGSSNGTFTVSTSAVTSVSSATITAAYGTDSVATTINVNPIQASVSVSPTSVVGGYASTGTITLSSAAPSGGLAVALSSSSGAASLPASVTVAAAAKTATFNIPTNAVASTNYIAITASSGGLSSSAQLNVIPLLNSISISPASVVGGAGATGTVTLNAKPLSTATIALSSNSSSASVPASITIPTTATSGAFAVTTTAVTANTNVTITGSNSGTQVQTGLSVLPLLGSLTLNPYSTYGGGTSIGTVTLNAKATSVVTVNLASSVTSVATVAVPSVTIPVGSTSATFNINAVSVTSNSSTAISASSGGVTLQQTLSVAPQNAPITFAIALNSSQALAGTTVQGTITLSSASSSAMTFTLASNATLVATVPASVTIPANATSVTFSVTTASVVTIGSATISATNNGTTKTASLQVVPLISSIFLDNSKVVNSDPVNATVYFYVQAPSGVSLSIASSNTSVATVATPISVTAGSYSVQFPVTTKTVSAESTTSISAAYNNATQSVTLTVEPTPVIASVTIVPQSVTGGSAAYGQVTLSGIAPAAGATVTLSSSNTSIATVPASVLIASGQTGASFTVATTPVPANTNLTITGNYQSSSKVANVTVVRPQLTGLSFAQTQMPGGSTDVATLTLSGPAATGGFTVQLAWTPITGAAVSGGVTPATVIVPAGSSTYNFPVQLSTVNYPVAINFTATATKSGSIAISKGETATAAVNLTLSSLHATDVNYPSGIQLQWGISAVGNYLLYRSTSATSGNTLIATLPNTTQTYLDKITWTSGSIYYYYLYDSTTNTQISAERVAAYRTPASQDQAVDSRLDPRYSTNVLKDYAFNGGIYHGGLFAGYSADPARIGRSFAIFPLTKPTINAVYRTGKVNAYAVTGYTDQGPANVSIGCQTIPSNTWTSAGMTWDTAPTSSSFNPAAAVSTARFQYDSTAPADLTATCSSGQAALTWIAPTTTKTITSYTVTYGTDPSFTYDQTSSGIAGTTATVTGLTNTYTCYFEVCANYSDGTTSNQSPPVAAAPPTGTVASPGPGTWLSWNLSNDISSACISSTTPTPYSVAWASMNETNYGWVYFAKSEFNASLAPCVIDLWSIPTLLQLQVPTPVSLAGGSATATLIVNAIGLSGHATVTLLSDNTAVAIVPASIYIDGLDDTFPITLKATGTAHITATLASTSYTQPITVTN